LSVIEFTTKTGFLSIVDQLTRGSSLLDKVYVSESCYEHIKVVNSSVKSDHEAIFAYNGTIKTAVIQEVYAGSTCQFFVVCQQFAKSFEYAVNMTDDVQQEFDRFYATIWDLLDRFYPEA